MVRFLAAAAAGAAMCASAATYVVNTTLDNTTGDSLCTLREAIASANNAGFNGDCGANSGADDSITFSVSGTITLGSQLPTVVSGQGALTIDGAAQSVTISGNNSVRVLQVDSLATLTLQNLTIANGRVSDYTGGNGAGVLNNGALTVTNSTFSGNSVSPPPYYSANGGGIYSVGPLTVTNSTFSGNSVFGPNAFGGGGGIYSGGPLTVTNSTFSGNSSANSGGGGIQTDNVTTGTITNSTFSGNSAVQGGGISNYIMTLTITNSTFSGNSANPTAGGGINNASAAMTVNNSTFSGNSGDGISKSSGTVTLRNTIVASSTGNNCGATAAIVNGGNNIDDGTTCGWGSTNGSMSSTSPNLGAITGSPAFFPLNVGSPAIDAGSNASCSTASQNGVARPADGDGNSTALCDIGSYEKPAIPLAAAPSVSATFTPSTQFLGNKGALRVVVSNPNTSTISGVTYSASLPVGLNFAFHTVGTDCTGEFFAGPDGNTLYVSSLSMPASTTCTIDVFFTAAAVGTYTHNAGAITVSSSAGSATNPSASSITMSLKPPGMQIFLPSTVALGTNASMTIALSRSSGDPNYFPVGASLGFPGGSTVANPSGFTAGCSASGAAPAGGNTVTTSGGNISFDGSCALASLLVAFPAAGTYTFTIPAGSFTYQVEGSATVFSNAASVTASIVVTSPAAFLSTSSLAFGNQVVGTTSASQQVTVTNSGNANLVISMFSIATGYSATACSGLLITLIPGQTCTFTVTFTPTASGTYPGALEIYTNAPGSPHSVALSGNGMTAPTVVLSTSSIAFGSVPVGNSASQNVTLNNTGSAGLTISSMSVSGTTAFAATGCSAMVAPGSSCTVSVTFTPTAATGYVGQLTIVSNASNSPHSVSLSGSGVAPGVSLAVPPSFGSVPVGGSGSVNASLTNTGSAPLSITSLTTTGAPFGVGSCASPLAAGATCTFSLTFTPTTPGSQTGTLTLISNAGGSPHTASLSGIGTQPAVSLAPAPADFGSVVVNTTSNVNVTLTNVGAAPLAISGISVSGAFFTQSGTTCPPSLPAGNSCAIAIAYAPTATGPHSGQLSVASNAPGTPHAVALAGTGTAPGVSLTPSPIAFGNVPVGGNASATLNLSNTGTAPLSILGIATSGTNFSHVTSCGTSLAPGANCAITVTYAPGATGSHTGQVSVSTNAGASPVVAPLSGTGTAPGVSVTPSLIAFGDVPVGGNASATLNLANTGTAPLAISSIVTTGTFFSNTTTCGATLAAGASCPIMVTYAPGAAGAHSGQVSVTTNAGAGPVVAPLSGTGAVPVLSLSSASVGFGSQTVGSASLTQPVTITNTGGAPLNLSAIAASGDFNFTGCPTPLSLAPGASCTLSIKFVPTAVGARSGGISIGSNASGTPHAIALTGNGTPVPVPGIALAPGSASFGAIVTGTNSTQVLVLSNPGTAPLAISSIGTTGAGFSQANTCPTSLAPSAACNISVTFAPTVEGPASGQLQIVSNAAPSPFNAALSGSGLPATTAGLTFSASNVAFPPQFVGTTSAPQTVTLTSSGTAPLAISQVTGSGDFAFSGCGPSTMAPAATCTFSITFRPQAVGPLTGSIVVTSNASGSPHSLALSGNGASLTAPEIVMAPSAFAFGTLRTARTATIVGRLNNTGAATLLISQIQATGAFFAQSNNCPATVAVGGFCDITVTYAPTATGAHSGQLAIRSNAIPSPHVTALSGTGITVPPPFLSTVGEVSFGQQVTGITVRRTLVLTNTGGDPLIISSMAIVGSGAFGVEGGCGTIAPEASCSLTLTFLATGINTFNARLDIISNHSGGAVQVRLSGQGVPLPQPDLDFSVGALGFGNQGLNTSAQPGRTVRLTNIGGAPVTISALRVTLPDFRIPAGACVGTMAPGAFCDIEVVFHPVAPGPRQASLVVDSTPAQNDSVALIGIGCRQILLGRNQSPARLCSP